MAFFHGPLIRFHVESPSALPWITHPVSVEYTLSRETKSKGKEAVREWLRSEIERKF